MNQGPRYWAVIPAAGTGTRMQSGLPKQYIEINGRPLIEHTLNPFCTHPKIEKIVVAISEQDTEWDKLECASHPKIEQTIGGLERCHSVLNALQVLSDMASPDDWVLVHDAARPCISHVDIDSLIDALSEHPVGGLLALPVKDTMKRADSDGQVSETVMRDGLWHALTPQMFRIAVLTSALEHSLQQGILVTDEAQAIELSGGRPRLIEGQTTNIKITRKTDIKLAELFLN